MATKKQIKKESPKEANATIAILSLAGEKMGEKSLPASIFQVESKAETISQYIRVFHINQRQGTVSTQSRGEVSYSTRKIYKQKGTGGARHGSRKAPIFVGGGVTFGPRPRDMVARMNKKQKKQVLFSTLTMKSKDGAIMCLSNDVVKSMPKTKEVAAFLKNQKIDMKKTLVVTEEAMNNFVMSGRNITGVTYVTSTSINPYLVLSHDSVIFVENALDMLETHFVKQS